MPDFSKEQIDQGLGLASLAEAVRQHDMLESPAFDLNALKAQTTNPAFIIVNYVRTLINTGVLIYLGSKIARHVGHARFIEAANALAAPQTAAPMQLLFHLTSHPPTQEPVVLKVDFLSHVLAMILALAL